VQIPAGEHPSREAIKATLAETGPMTMEEIAGATGLTHSYAVYQVRVLKRGRESQRVGADSFELVAT
jgi:hypothetical protein